ncbi:MAG: hypothetical protein Q9215_006576 [Flavoplaca cf. flavocitrina]
MDWNKWSGFVGSGTYIIINKASLYALDLDSNGDLISLHFRSIKHPGFVLSQDSSGDYVILWQEEQEDDKGEREVQKWLMQRQEDEVVVLS